LYLAIPASTRVNLTNAIAVFSMLLIKSIVMLSMSMSYKTDFLMSLM
jgi:hypothetical protein